MFEGIKAGDKVKVSFVATASGVFPGSFPYIEIEGEDAFYQGDFDGTLEVEKIVPEHPEPPVGSVVKYVDRDGYNVTAISSDVNEWNLFVRRLGDKYEWNVRRVDKYVFSWEDVLGDVGEWVEAP